MIRAGDLNRRVQFLRAELVDDGLQERPGALAALGSPVWASRRDVMDAEVQRMGLEFGTLTSRFVVRSSSFTRGLSVGDWFDCDSKRWEVRGIKQVHDRAGLEITATAKVT